MSLSQPVQDLSLQDPSFAPRPSRLGLRASADFIPEFLISQRLSPC